MPVPKCPSHLFPEELADCWPVWPTAPAVLLQQVRVAGLQDADHDVLCSDVVDCIPSCPLGTESFVNLLLDVRCLQ